MEKNVDPRQQEVRDLVKVFAKKEILPRSEELDRMAEPRKFPRDVYGKLGEAGFIGYCMPKDLGGGGNSHLEFITLVEELCYYDAGVGLLCAVGELATQPIMNFANDELKKKYVPDCASGKRVPAFVLTEPNAGSDAANQSTEAVEDGDQFIINGEKIFIMHGDVAHVGVVFGKIQEEGVRDKVSAVIVPFDLPGVKSATLQHKMGMKYATTARLWFENVKVPRKNLLGEPGKGFKYAMITLDGARIGIAAQATGLAQRALDESIKYSKARIAFGSPISKLQAIQWMIADMSTRIEAGRLLTYKAAQAQDAGERYSLFAAQAKLFTAEMSNFCVDRAMQIHSGYGYIGEFSSIEKLYRDQRITEIYEGTSEIQRLVIANSVLRG
ncbi:MAG: acyl-CoA dehydrogenase family protein [candidate division Zixibacteria bacterium]|nr:acyl-CoA dehydrogenase family protein [candidate division Zixibacteria bacterium]